MKKLSHLWSLLRITSPLAKTVFLYRLWRWNRARRQGKPEGTNEALVNLMLASVPFLGGHTGLLLSILPAISPIIEAVVKTPRPKLSSFIPRRSS